MITLGIQLGGSTAIDCIMKAKLLMAAQTAARVRDPHFKSCSEGWLNPIFIVPGSVQNPDFEGLKIGHFSKKEKGLVVAIAVPQSVADGKDMSEFIIKSLRQAVGLAAAHFATKDISFSSLKAEKIILAIDAELSMAAT
jgi:hypothetical protein